MAPPRWSWPARRTSARTASIHWAGWSGGAWPAWTRPSWASGRSRPPDGRWPTRAWGWRTWTWSRSTRPSRPSTWRSSGSSGSTASAPMWTAAPSRWAIRSARAARGSPRTCCTRSAGAADGTAWAPPASAAGRARRSSSKPTPPEDRSMELLLPLLAVAVLYSFVSLRVVRQYERGVAFFLGRFWGTKGPGLIFLPAGFAAQKRVSLRIMALDIPPQDVITRANVSVKVNAVLYMRVTDPAKAIIEIEDYLYATSQLAQTTLRSVLGEVELDELLSDREKINAVLKKIIDERTDPWGIEVSAVEVKDVDLPDQMKRAMARQAEAERERRAKVIAAQGELQASQTLAQAARQLATEPSALQLRYLQTVTEIAAENNSTTIFPIPIELFRPFLNANAPAASPPRTEGSSEPPGAALPASHISSLMSQLRIQAAQEPPKDAAQEPPKE